MDEAMIGQTPQPVPQPTNAKGKKPKKVKQPKKPKNPNRKTASIFSDKKLLGIVIAGVALFAVILYVVITSTSTVKAVMLNDDQPAGTVITAEMVTTEEVPYNTPGNFIKNESEVVGKTLKNPVEAHQFIYLNDFMANWQSYVEDENVNEDFVITSIMVPDEQAVGGLITAGDTIDIMGVSSRGVVQGFDESGNTLEKQGYSTRDQEATQVYYILSNVKVLNTNSALASSQGNDMNSVSGDSTTSGNSYYIIALSYDDCKKLRQAEGVFDSIWLNIAPRQNQENSPLINQMIGQSFSQLHDSQMVIQDRDGNILESYGDSVNLGDGVSVTLPEGKTE